MTLKVSDKLGRVHPVLLDRMQDLIDNAMRRTRVLLINRLGMSVPVRFGSIGHVTAEELLEQTEEDGTAVYIQFEFEPGGHQGLLAISGTLLNRLMGLLLGEDPYAEPTPYIRRAATRMDLRIAERLASDIFAGLLDSLPTGTGGKVRVTSVAGDRSVDMPTGWPGTFLDIPLDFGPPEDPYGVVTLALPSAVTSTLWPDVKVEKKPKADRMARVLPLPVTVVAELQRVQIPLSSLQDLASGSLIPLSADGAVTLTVSGRPIMNGLAGMSTGNRCVKVERRQLPAV